MLFMVGCWQSWSLLLIVNYLQFICFLCNCFFYLYSVRVFLLFKYVCRFCFLYLPPVSASVPVSAASVFSVSVFNIICSAASLLFTCMLWAVPGFLFVFSTCFICSCLLIYFIILLFALFRYLSVAVFEGYYHIAVFLFLLALEIGMGGWYFFLWEAKCLWGKDCFMRKELQIYHRDLSSLSIWRKEEITQIIDSPGWEIGKR